MNLILWALGDAWGLPKDQRTESYGPASTSCRSCELVMSHWIALVGGSRPRNRGDSWRLCREMARYMEDDDYQTRMVFQLDQTCSGYGHLACLLRDKTWHC